EDARLPDAPIAFGTREREGALVEIDRGARLDAAAGEVSRRGERADRPVRERAVRRVEVERGLCRLFEVVRDRTRILVGVLVGETLRDTEMEIPPLALRQRVVGDVAQEPVPEPPDALAVLLPDEELLVLERRERVLSDVDDALQLVDAEVGARKDGRAPDEPARIRGEMVDARGDDRLP